MSFEGPTEGNNRARSATGVVRQLLPFFAPYMGRLVLVGVMLIIGTLAGLASPYLIGVAVDQFIDPSGMAAPFWLGGLLPMDASRTAGLTTVMLVLLGTYLLSWVAGVAQFRLMVRVAQQVLLEMRSDILRQIQRLSLDFYATHETGDLMSRLINDTQVINDMFGAGLMRVLGMVLSLIGIIIAMFALNWRLTLAAFAVLPLIVVVVTYFTRLVRQAFRRTRQTIGEVSAELQENISAVREVQAFAREEQSLAEFRAVNERNRVANVTAQTITSLFLPLMDVLSTTATALVVGVGGYMVLGFDPPLVTVGVIVSFLAYVRRFYDPIRELADLFGQLQGALAGAERIFDLLDVVPGVMDDPDAAELPPIEGHVAYEHVSFRYETDEPVLEDVSVEIEAGQMIALVGPTGAGKTTLANLLIRFYDPDSGRVCIDGYDIRHVTMASLRRQIGVVLQDTFLFSGTVMDNLRYGRLEATDDEVYEAARMANAHDFISRLPKGYDTEIGERGAMLSQGNRQLIAIARAILNDPRVLILDEATSSVDTRTELLIQRALGALMAGRTSVVIAHRLSTIRNADQILVIQDGCIAERGRHDELLAAEGIYYDLYMSQFRRQEEMAADLPGEAGPA